MFNPIDTAPAIKTGKQFSIEFDVWAKRWKPSTDDFEWQRFTNCKRIYQDRKQTIVGFGDEWRAVYWVEIVRPEEAGF